MCGCFKKLSDALPSIEGNSLKRFLQVHMHVGRARGETVVGYMHVYRHSTHTHHLTAIKPIFKGYFNLILNCDMELKLRKQD